MGQFAAIGPAYDQARALGHGPPFCTGIRTVPTPRPTPALDALACKLTAFPTFLALLAGWAFTTGRNPRRAASHVFRSMEDTAQSSGGSRP